MRKERQRWLAAFQRSYLFALRSLSFPSLLNATTAPVTQVERLSCTSFLEAGIVPKSPSLQGLDGFDEAQERGGKDDSEGSQLQQQEREERAWWAVRLKQVRKELESDMMEGQVRKMSFKRNGVVGSKTLPVTTSPSGREEKKVKKAKSFGIGLGLGDFVEKKGFSGFT